MLCAASSLFFDQTRTDTVWLQAWGSHLFFSIVAYVNRARSADSWWGRPMILSKFGKPDWRPGMDSRGHAESPAQHRYPVRAPLSGLLQVQLSNLSTRLEAGLVDW